MSADVVREDGPAPPSRGRRAFLVLLTLLVVVVGGIAAYSFATANRENTDDAVVEADVVAVTSRVPGLVSRVLVQDNQMVKKGDVLLEIDSADLSARVAQARAELETATAQAAGAHAQEPVVAASARGGLQSAQAQLAASTAAVQTADAQIAVAQAAVVRAQAEVDKADRDLTRAKELVASDAIARQQLDAAQLASDAAHAALRQAQANVTAAQESKRSAESRVVDARARVSQTAPVPEQIQTAQSAASLADARVKAAEAALQLAELQLSYTKVLAPNDGLVSQLSARSGAMIASGQPLAQLVPVGTYLVANFKETQIDRMRPGDRAEVKIDAYPGRTFEATVESLSGGTGSRFSLIPPDNASGNFVKVVQRVPVRLSWSAPPDAPMKAGLSADVTVFVGDAK
ncbi:MAG: HlyD family secretion protein [Vicinamibacterales bacterium]